MVARLIASQFSPNLPRPEKSPRSTSSLLEIQTLGLSRRCEGLFAGGLQRYLWVFAVFDGVEWSFCLVTGQPSGLPAISLGVEEGGYDTPGAKVRESAARRAGELNTDFSTSRWFQRREGAMSLKWIAQHLDMGSRTYVSNLLADPKAGKKSK